MIKVTDKSSFFSKQITEILLRKQPRIMLVGLPGAGKTTILSAVEMGETVKTAPVPGYFVETLDYKGGYFTIFDIDGPLTNRVTWKHYYQNTDGVIFVIDSSDKDGIYDVSEELYSMINEEELKDAVILILAHKQDLANVMTQDEIIEKLKLDKLKGRQWLVQCTSAVTGQGFKEGFDWFFRIIGNRA